MLKLLLKKQLQEIFRSYFYDGKKKKMRSKASIALWFLLYGVLMIGVLGGIAVFLGISLCGPLTEVGVGWLYFILFGGFSILLGAFGSVFNTYAGLYLSKDNDFLLSMPVPVWKIIVSRLLTVYLLGLLFSSVVLVPALIVYWCTAGLTAARAVCGFLLLLMISLLVLVLSCLLGWCVAKISRKLKNKSAVAVLASVAFLVLYCVFYFKAAEVLQDLLQNAAFYGDKIRGSAALLYHFGRIGEGSLPAAAAGLAAVSAVAWGVWLLLKKTFLGIVTEKGKSRNSAYREKAARVRTPFRAVLAKEFGRFASSANYMLNCGLGVLFIPAGSIFLLIKGRALADVLNAVFGERPGCTAILLCSAMILLSSIIDAAAPSVSLEGKNIWILQSMPIRPRMVLRAKIGMQLILSLGCMLFAGICLAAVLQDGLAVKLLAVLLLCMCAVFSAVFSAWLGTRMPNLSWTNELIPIKQSGCVTISIFGIWGIAMAFGGLYLLIGYKIGAALYLLLWLAVLGTASLAMLRWLDTEGSRIFAEL